MRVRACVCVCACVRACVRAGVRVCVGGEYVCEYVCMSACVRACVGGCLWCECACVLACTYVTYVTHQRKPGVATIQYLEMHFTHCTKSNLQLTSLYQQPILHFQDKSSISRNPNIITHLAIRM